MPCLRWSNGGNCRRREGQLACRARGFARPVLLALCLLAAGCAGPDRRDADTLTRREKDSLVAESGIPGAGGVRGAMTGADSAAARAARLDSLSRNP